MCKLLFHRVLSLKNVNKFATKPKFCDNLWNSTKNRFVFTSKKVLTYLFKYARTFLCVKTCRFFVSVLIPYRKSWVKATILCCCLVFVQVFLLNASASEPTEVIDSPTADVVEYSHYNLGFRLYGGGGVLAKMVFGVFKPINIGMSWDINQMIGPGSARIDTRPPTIFFKARVFAGGMMLPAVAVGYDGQGYGGFDTPLTEKDKYQFREKGIFVTCTREYFIPGLTASFGGNIYDFGGENLFGFVGATYDLENKLILMGEYDNIHSKSFNRANIGATLLVAENINIEVAGRNLFRGPASERIAIIKYKGKF